IPPASRPYRQYGSDKSTDSLVALQTCHDRRLSSRRQDTDPQRFHSRIPPASRPYRQYGSDKSTDSLVALQTCQDGRLSSRRQGTDLQLFHCRNQQLRQPCRRTAVGISVGCLGGLRVVPESTSVSME